VIPPLTSRPSIFQVGVASLWSVATVADAETLYIYINQTYYDYELDMVPQSWPNTCCKWESKRITYSHFFLWDQAYIRWGCIQMITIYSRRCWNTLNMYEVHLLRVWSGCYASHNHNLQGVMPLIIITCISMIQVRNQENFLFLLTLLVWDSAYIRLGLHPYDL
jgi:hypothetical protein